MPNGVVLRDYPTKAESQIEVKSLSRNMREFLPRTQERHRIDATTSILRRKTGTPTFVALRPSECEKLSRKGSKEDFVKTTQQDLWDRSKNASHITTGFNDRLKDTCGSRGSTFNAIKLRRRLADRVSKRQPDLATQMMSEQPSLSLHGDHEQSTILQLSLDCIDQTVEPITELASVREQSMHSGR